MAWKRCANCPVLIHKVGHRWEHVLPPYVFCLNPTKIGARAEPR
jgi:hypothetical protein